MRKFSKWEIEDIEMILEDYPEVKDKSDEELLDFARKLYWEAQGLFEEANCLEGTAETIKKYIEYRKTV